MAKSMKFKSFNEGGEEVRFSSVLFRGKLNEWKSKQKMDGEKATLEQAYELIADAAHVSMDSVKNWAKGNNGPSDFQTVRQIASTLGIDQTDLIVPANDKPETLEKDFKPTEGGEKELVIQIYKLFIDYIYWFIGTENDSYALRVLERPEEDRMDYIWNLYHFLDQIALSVSQDTYQKLRKLIAQLNVLSYSYADSEMKLPDLWYKLNPNLYPVTNSLFDTDKTLDDVLDKGYRTNWNGNGSKVETPYDMERILFHNIEDDLTDYSEYLTVLANERRKERRTLVEAVIDEGEAEYLTYQIISREVAATLTMVMRHLFPQYFGIETEKESAEKTKEEKK